MTGGPDSDGGPDRSAVPIAVVGVACRLPHAPDPDAFWQLLRDGRSAVTAVPDGRWSGAALGDLPRYGGFLDDVAGFDADFFGIAAGEADAMDPQQRLMLELGWESLADAGTGPAAARASDTGVFVGAIWDDYAHLVLRGGPGAITAYSMTGLNRGAIANRLSHAFGLHGPSLVVDTGQSSSLVAVYLAMESLRRDECALALAGGVNLALLTDSATNAARMGGLSPDGRCYTFDARANGYVRGEGGGMVALKPLPAALAAGDRIYCVLRGGAVNNDGTTRTITLPSARAQEELLRLAYRRSGVMPGDVQYVELHGTGTPTGDPVEAAALGAALGARRPAGQPLLVGSAKTNVGHLEGAAGIVGLIKVALSIAHRAVPASLNFASPNPAIALDDLGLAVVRAGTPWPRPERPLTAGVSAFGMGGTNCHLVLTEAPDRSGEVRPAAVRPGYRRRRHWFDAAHPAPVAERPAAASPAAASGADALLETVRVHSAAVLGLATPAAVDPERTFEQLGLGSLEVVELHNRLMDATGLTLGVTVVYDCPTPAALARHLRAGLAGEDPGGAPAVLADLDRLAETLARLAPHDAQLRIRIAARLRELIDVLAVPPEPADDTAAFIMAASPEELFELIDHPAGHHLSRGELA